MIIEVKEARSLKFSLFAYAFWRVSMLKKTSHSRRLVKLAVLGGGKPDAKTKKLCNYPVDSQPASRYTKSSLVKECNTFFSKAAIFIYKQSFVRVPTCELNAEQDNVSSPSRS
ncbi:hypothetical protein [Coleofasciculus sp. FACHB-SPT9]|uniref:hypothetical protein n=1 Tax=Coleofasciculus sp. FACHB-SPT9 TaxID=2692791 RepID=UPI00168A2AB8|nr:hypothetical protein [Coleofasciculus sp. FACHB-SPT9]MBD1891224.1 hypothetical protein [Coleofasciculus sp. FACHB-SPT9]